MTTKTIAIDIDGVLADFVLDFRKIANRLFGVAIYNTFSQQNWDFTDLSPAHLSNIWGEITTSETFWEGLPQLCGDGELSAIQRLRLDGHNVYFVTSRPGMTARQQTITWLEEHGILMPSVEVVRSAADKPAKMVELGVEWSIEDSYENAVAIGALPHVTSYLINRPYNKGRSWAYRVDTLMEFIKLCEGQSDRALEDHERDLVLLCQPTAHGLRLATGADMADDYARPVLLKQLSYCKLGTLTYPVSFRAYETARAEQSAMFSKLHLKGCPAGPRTATQVAVELDALRAAGRIVREFAWNKMHVVCTEEAIYIDGRLFGPASNPETITAEAERLVMGPRREAYSHPREDYARTGAMWGALLHDWAKEAAKSPTPIPIPASLACLLMVCVKLSRESHKSSRDNRVDGCGYFLCADLIEQQTEKEK